MVQLRRIFDLTCAVVGLLLLSPLFAAIAAAIKLEDSGPIFYSQWRVGKGFRPFRLHKFRSMVPAADRFGRSFTGPHDPRITRVGAFLRRYKLDELPQLFNVVKGEMQLVGARPELELYVRLYSAEYTAILREPPGITDPASVAFRHEDRLLGEGDPENEYTSRILPLKLAISLDYQRRRGVLRDLRVIFATLVGVGTLTTLTDTAPLRHHSQRRV